MTVSRHCVVHIYRHATALFRHIRLLRPSIQPSSTYRMDTESGPKGLIGRRSFFSSPIAVTKFHGEPRHAATALNTRNWKMQQILPFISETVQGVRVQNLLADLHNYAHTVRPRMTKFDTVTDDERHISRAHVQRRRGTIVPEILGTLTYSETA